MFNADAVLGWISSGTAMIDAWNIPSGDYYYIQANNAVTPSWALDKAIVQSMSGGVTTTTICFSRPFTVCLALLSRAQSS